MPPFLTHLHHDITRHGATVTAHDVWKCAALLLMTCDHIGFYFDQDQLWWRVVGRWCVPIWFFLAGYSPPSSPRKELFWLAAVMIVADIAMVSPLFPVNILITIMIARFAVAYMAARDKDLFMVIIFAFACFLLMPATMYVFEYGTQVFLFALAGYYRATMRNHWLGGVTLALACATFAPVQAWSFHMPALQAGVMSVGLIVVCVLLHGFHSKRYPHLSTIPFASTALRVFGRTTQYYYAIHVMLFLALQTWMHPPEMWKIVWFNL
jgi:TraX protein